MALVLPCSEGMEALLSSRSASGRQEVAEGTVLLIDDNDEFRAALAEHLRDDGHTVAEYAAPDGVPALHLLGGVALVIVDFHLPGENGLAFADRFHSTHPRVPILIVTAHWTARLGADVAARDFVHLLCKPLDYFTAHELIEQLTGNNSH